jgi:deoxyadenosine/deoxycytidine kinase
MVVISIEGNVGAGKSTLLKKLKEAHQELNYVPEPVDTWMEVKDKDDNNILKLFYSDFKRWSYTFQNFAFITRTLIMDECIKNKTDSDIFITERCVFTDKNVFAKMLYDDKLMTDLEYSIYNFWFDKYSKTNKVDGYIYLTTNVDLSSERIKTRNREGENIETSYLERLDQYHHNWLDKEDKPVLYYDTESDDINKVFDFIKSFEPKQKIKYSNYAR